MTTSSSIIDYLGQGTHAARPASPNVPSGGTAIYYETDTTNTFAWTGSAWVQINAGGGGGATPAIVQFGVDCSGGVSGITLGAAPTSGNRLIALMAANGINSPSTGWAVVPCNSNNLGLYVKTAGGSESATQTPVTSGINGAMAIYEVSNAGVGVKAEYAGNSGSAIAWAQFANASSDLILGCAMNNSNTDVLTSVTNGVVDATAPFSGGSRSGNAFHGSPVAAGVNTLTGHLANSDQLFTILCTIYGL